MRHWGVILLGTALIAGCGHAPATAPTATSSSTVKAAAFSPILVFSHRAMTEHLGPGPNPTRLMEQMLYTRDGKTHSLQFETSNPGGQMNVPFLNYALLDGQMMQRQDCWSLGRDLQSFMTQVMGGPFSPDEQAAIQALSWGR